jgi:hypothetical protein
MSPIVCRSVTREIPKYFRIIHQFIKHINNFLSTKTLKQSLCDNGVLPEGILLLPKDVILGQKMSMTIEVADPASRG